MEDRIKEIEDDIRNAEKLQHWATQEMNKKPEHPKPDRKAAIAHTKAKS